MENLPHYHFSWIVSFQKQRYHICELFPLETKLSVGKLLHQSDLRGRVFLEENIMHADVTTTRSAKNKRNIRALCIYTGCPRRNVPNFGRVFLMLKYTDITQNTNVQS